MRQRGQLITLPLLLATDGLAAQSRSEGAAVLEALARSIASAPPRMVANRFACYHATSCDTEGAGELLRTQNELLSGLAALGAEFLTLESTSLRPASATTKPPEGASVSTSASLASKARRR